VGTRGLKVVNLEGRRTRSWLGGFKESQGWELIGVPKGRLSEGG